MSTVLLIIIMIVLFGGGGYHARSHYVVAGLDGVPGTVLVVSAVLWLLGAAGAWVPRRATKCRSHGSTVAGPIIAIAKILFVI